MMLPGGIGSFAWPQPAAANEMGYQTLFAAITDDRADARSLLPMQRRTTNIASLSLG